jgi:hypothetical protein
MDQIDLAQFVSDYLQIEGASRGTNAEIAEAYLEACGSEEPVTEPLTDQIAYYR